MDEIIEEPTQAPVPEPEEGGMYLTYFAVYDLGRAAKWAKFLAIVGFIASAFIAVMALFVGAIFSSASSLTPVPAAMGSILTVVYLIVAAVSFVICLFLYQFADRTSNAIVLNDKLLLERGVHRLQSFFKAYGILTIIYLSIMVLAFVFGGLVTAFMHH
jgi:amino acid transporter